MFHNPFVVMVLLACLVFAPGLLLAAAGSRTPFFSSHQPGGLFVIQDQSQTTGDSFFVHSGTGTNGAGYGQNPDSPVATIDYAIGLCTASKGDRIYVMPGHAESLTGATSCVADVAGVQIIGLGTGALRPKLTYTTAAAATLSVTAANVHIEDIQFYSDYTGGITAGVTVGASADGFRMKNCRFEEAANTKEFLITVSVAAACHDVIIDGFDFFGVTGGSDTQCIKFAGASNFSVVRDFRIYGDFSGAPIDGLTAASTYMTIEKGTIINDDTTAGLSVSVHASTTGMMSDLRIAQLKDTVGPAGAAMAYSEVYVTNAAGVQGILKPVADS